MDGTTGRALIDALVLRELFSGREPSGEVAAKEPSSYLVTWPEYLFLGKLILRLSSKTDPPFIMQAAEELSEASAEASAGGQIWRGAFLDLGRVQDLHGTSIQVSDPHPEAAQAVVDAMFRFSLDAREATNLVFAKTEDVPFIASDSTLSDHMLAALARSSVDYRLQRVS